MGGLSLRIGAVQLRLYPNIRKNIDNIRHWLNQAGAQGLDLVNFPETSLTGYIIEMFPEINQDDIERGLDELQEIASKLSLGVIMGTPFRDGSILFNSVAVLLPDGRRYLYHKRNLVSYEKQYFSPGNQPLAFEYKGGTFATIICRDQSFPVLASDAKQQGVQVLFISCAHYYSPTEARLKIDKNRALPIARASENGFFVCKANSIGTHYGKINLGHSLIVAPNGVVICEAGETDETLLSFEIDPSTDWSWRDRPPEPA